MRRGLAAVAIAALLGGFVAARFEFSADVTAFLPTEGDRNAARLSKTIAGGSLSRTMVLLIQGSDTHQVVDASRRLEAALKAHPDVRRQLEFLEGGPEEGFDRAVYELYHPRRFSFVAETEQAARQRATHTSLDDSAKSLVRRLRQPGSSLLTRVVPSDPLLILPDLFDRLQRSRARELQLIDGRFVTADGKGSVILVASRESAFNSEAQKPFLAGIKEAFREVQSQTAGSLELQQSGINRFAVRAEESIRADIQRVTVFSFLGLSLLMWLLFRSFRLVLLAAIPIAFGVLVGSATTLAVYGRIHGVTLAFGASLIGVCIDYIVHFYCHHAVAPHRDGPSGTLSVIWKALLTGAATTMIGFAALGWSSFRGLQEVALFSSTGILAALLSTRALIPSLLPREPRPVPLRERLVAGLDRTFDALRSRRRALIVAPLGALVFIAFGLTHAHWNEEFASLNRLDPELLAEDTAVRARVTRLEQQRFVLAIGASEEQALRVNDHIAASLAEAQRAEELGSFHSLATWLPSAKKQHSIATAFRTAPELWTRTKTAYAAAGVRPEALEPFRRSLEAETPPPLTYAELLGSPLAALVRPFRIETEGQVGFLTFLHDVRNADGLEKRIEALEGAAFIDQSRILDDANRAYQQTTFELIVLGLLGVLLMLLLRYRNLRKVLAAFVPSLMAAAIVLAALSLADQGIDLVALTALLMVVSIGVDYGVFLVDADDAGSSGRSAALLSVTVAWCSTVLGFGLLSLSSYPALHTIGFTALVGVSACFVLAPTALILAKGGVPR